MAGRFEASVKDTDMPREILDQVIEVAVKKMVSVCRVNLCEDSVFHILIVAHSM